MPNQKLIIIGGGAAGLMAATELADQFDITILEARSRLGGRIHSFPATNSPFVIEAGAEFIHGKVPVTLGLLNRAGIHFVAMKGDMYRKEKGKWKEQTDMIEGWDKLLKTMKSLERDMTMDAFLQKYYGGDEYAALRRHVTSFSEGFDIADIKKVSVKELYKEWSHEGGENYRIPEGYGAMINFLKEEAEQKGCKIFTDQTAKRINWEKNSVTVYTADEQKYQADKLVITVPVSVLRTTTSKGFINFTPKLDEYINAAHEIGMGAVIKIILLFKKAFWKKDAGFIFSDEVYSTWWTQLPDTTPVLTGWVGGPKAERLSIHSKEDIVDKALLSLGSIFEKTTEELKENLLEGHVFNWQQDEYSAGAYSYAMPSTEAAKKLLNTPIDNTLFFAGEALYEGTSPGTVEAALVSGIEVARKLLSVRDF